jgi:PhzF family phenazine biosynthesis protein
MVAFPDGPGGGNPAGVVLDAGGMSDAEMLAVAAEVGYAETAFVTADLDGDPPTAPIRYFSPVAEVPFCGHATIATAVALAARSGSGPMRFQTPVGPYDVVTRDGADGPTASFTSGEPVVGPIDDVVLDRLLAVLGLERDALAADHPPRLSATGNVHPVLTVGRAVDLDRLAFDPSALRALMLEQGWLGTVTVLHRVAPLEYEARNPFPVGTMDEDPATGSAAASTGAYLRAEGLVMPPARVVIRQGRHVGRPSVLLVDVPPAGGITVTGGAQVLGG